MKTDEWFSVLKLAKMSYFVDLHDLAVENITTQPVDPVQRIVLAKEYYVADWLQTGCVELAERTLAPSVQDVGRIGCSRSTLLFHVREKRIANDSEGYIDSWVQTAFAEELKDLEKQYQNFINDGLR